MWVMATVAWEAADEVAAWGAVGVGRESGGGLWRRAVVARVKAAWAMETLAEASVAAAAAAAAVAVVRAESALA